MGNAKGTAPANADDATPTNDVDLVNMSREELLGLPAAEQAPTTESDEAEDDAVEDAGEEATEGESVTESPEGEEEGEGEEGEEEEEEEEGDEPASDEAPKKLTPAEIQALWKSNRELLGLKGRQGQKLGDKDQEIARLQQQLAEARGEKPQAADTTENEYPQSKEEWDELFVSNPLKAQSLFYKMQRENEIKQAEADRQADQAEQIQATPFVGADIFIRENGIENFDKWTDSPEGLAVLEIIGGNRTSKLAMLAAINTGDAEGVAEILGNGLTAARKGTAITRGKKIAKVEAKKVEDSKPRSVPRPGQRVNPPGRKTLATVTSQDLLDMSDADFRKQFGNLL